MLKKNKRSITICNLALFFLAFTMIAAAQVITWIYQNAAETDGWIKGKLFGMMALLAFIGVILLLLRDYVKDIINTTYQDVTGIHNKKSLEKKIQQLKERDDTLNVGMMIFDLNNLKQVNDQYGHECGDDFIQSFASCLTRITTANSFLARFGGDEFVIIQEKTSLEELEQMDLKLQLFVDEYNEKAELLLSYAVGYDVSYKNHYFLIEDLMDVVDKKMYQDKVQKKSIRRSICKDCPETYVAIPSVSPDILASKIQGIIYRNVNKRYAILMSDIENFHFINESYGYQLGNELLDVLAKEFAIFEHTVLSNRFHTDVFISVVDVSDISDESFMQKVEERNTQIADMIKEKYPISYFRINTGIRMVDQQDAVPENLISFANLARRKAKEYSDHICVYTDALNEEEQMEGKILNSFRQAIKQEEFRVFFQPKIDAKTLRICGAEALVRWIKDEVTIWTPNVFIPLLEKAGFITELDFYVYEKVFQWMRERADKGETPIPISVNVSRLHLKNPEKFMEKVFDLIMKYRIHTDYIIFEITESMFMEQPDVINDIVGKFHDKGIKISMDDFGAGYSSLNVLKDILFDEVKIDKQFLENDLSERGKIVLQELFHMLRRMHKSIVCEGVETKEISDFLVQEGCDELQGFFFYRPMDEEAFRNIMRKNEKKVVEIR